jgi:catechol 2,3-dioxygenase-like lactoylglutathione lyase family enzyme
VPVSVRFNHVAIAARDRQQSAPFLADLLGVAQPTSWGPFLSATLDDGVRLDYAEPGIEFPGQHYALLVSDEVFDRALERIREGGVPFWADPAMRHPGPGDAPPRRDQHQPRRAGRLLRRPVRPPLRADHTALRGDVVGR